ncbi:hypothetical protein OWP19_23860 [Bacillus cereus]|uniref:hypothetical protein n=1 Tax=Bacillus cereus group TaxID=86661 RepID=UPI002549DEF2|nr:hypothetical protein [Bacillus cereus]MDK7481007.1 hypothetical protein [Bacillus cereus]HDR8003427.1 hypothetical protein [Bacillus cereus]HDR8014974.1 hypothetical protein [Bacillus cereus]
MNERKLVKSVVKDVLKTTVGVKKIVEYRPKLLQQTDFPSIVITIPKAREERYSASAPYGKKIIKYTVSLEVTGVDVSPDGAGQLQFDDFLDAIDVELRKDPTFGGKVLSAGVEYIQTNTTAPQLLNGQTVGLLAIKQFDVSILTTG